MLFDGKAPPACRKLMAEGEPPGHAAGLTQ
jgi:hypothetical protein